MMTLTVNGELRELPDHASVADLLAALDMRGKAVAVEVNQELVPRRAHADTHLAPHDRVEVVTLVGGG